jgi:hypothetical protein
MSVNHIGGVIVIVLALSVVKILESGQTKDYQIVIGCFDTIHVEWS